jgi:hypothetical protein
MTIEFRAIPTLSYLMALFLKLSTIEPDLPKQEKQTVP